MKRILPLYKFMILFILSSILYSCSPRLPLVYDMTYVKNLNIEPVKITIDQYWTQFEFSDTTLCLEVDELFYNNDTFYVIFANGDTMRKENYDIILYDYNGEIWYSMENMYKMNKDTYEIILYGDKKTLRFKPVNKKNALFEF